MPNLAQNTAAPSSLPKTVTTQDSDADKRGQPWKQALLMMAEKEDGGGGGKTDVVRDVEVRQRAMGGDLSA